MDIFRNSITNKEIVFFKLYLIYEIISLRILQALIKLFEIFIHFLSEPILSLLESLREHPCFHGYETKDKIKQE